MTGHHKWPPRSKSDEAVTVPAGFEIAYNDEAHKYWIDGEPVVSVTTVLGVLDKPALPWWGMKVGVSGVCGLIDNGYGNLDWEHPDAMRDGTGALNDEQVISLLTRKRMTVNHVRDKAADRGKGAHHALEQLAATGRLDLSKMEPEDQGYASAVLDWWLEAKPEDCVTEQMVGSREHGFAGRYDLDCVIDGQRHLVDLKTGAKKGIYETHVLQLAGYEIAAEESGYGTFDKKAVLKATPDGKYEFIYGWVIAEDYLAVLGAYNALQRVKASMKKKAKAAA